MGSVVRRELWLFCREPVFDRPFSKLRESSRAPSLIDCDGTLAPFGMDPERAIPYPKVRERPDAIVGSRTARAVVIIGHHAGGVRPISPISMEARS